MISPGKSSKKVSYWGSMKFDETAYSVADDGYVVFGREPVAADALTDLEVGCEFDFRDSDEADCEQ